MANAATLYVDAEYGAKLTGIVDYVNSKLTAADAAASGHPIHFDADTSGLEKSGKHIDKTMRTTARAIEKSNIGNAMTTQVVQAGSDIQDNVKKTSKVIRVGSKEYATAMRQSVSAISHGEKTLAKFSKAKTGKTADSWYGYEGAVKNIRDIVSKLDAGEMTQEKFKELFGEARNNMKLYESEMIAAGEATQTFGDRMRGAFTRLGRYVAASTVIYQGIRAVKEMASASIEVESAMNRIQIVTGASDREMSAFFTTASTQARELGKSITDVAGSIETFSRLGYNLKDAAELSKYATIMSNVGDTDVDSATTGITSIIKGYNLNPGDAERVSDVLVTVGKNYAISAEELMTAFERGGAALAASGTDFEKSAALFAATNASLQNAQMTGTMWKTVSARIRGATSELEEMGEDTTGLAEGLSKYRDEIMALSGVDIMKNENEYKDMYTIFTELASVWDNINGDEAKARVAEILGGTRQLSGIMSTITNIKDAEGAYSDAMNSAGESARANDKYMETTAAHIGQLKATFQQFSSDFMSSSLLKGLVDAGNTLLKVLDAIISKFGALTTIAAGVGLFKTVKAAHSAGGLLGLAKGIAGKLSGGSSGAEAIAESSGELIQGSDGVYTMAKGSDVAASAGGKLLGVLKALGPAGIAVAAAGVAVGYGMYRMANAYKYAKKESDEAISSYNETKSELDSVNSELDTTQARIAELESKKSLSAVEQSEYEKLKKYNEQLEIQKSTLENISEVKKKTAAQKAEKVLKEEKITGEQKNDITGVAGISRAPASKIGKNVVRSGYDNILDLIQQETDTIEEFERQRDEQLKRANTASDNLSKYDKEVDKAKKKYNKLSNTEKLGIFGDDEKIAKDKKIVGDYGKAVKDRKNAQKEYDAANKESQRIEEEIAKSEKNRAEYLDEIQPQIEAIRAYNPESEYVRAYDRMVDKINAKTPSEKLDAFFSGKSNIKQYLEEASNSGKDLEDALSGIGLSISDLGIENIGELSSYLRDAASSADDAKSSFDGFRKGVKDIESATESENQDKDWSTVQAAYQTAKDMLDKGMTGTDDFQTMAQFLSPKNIAAAAKKAAEAGGYAADEYQKAFQRAQRSADRWFGEDETESLKNFVKDFQGKGLFDVKTDDMGLWDIKTKFKTTAEAAKEFGMSAQSVDTMLKSLEAYGYDFSGITKSGDAINEYESALSGLNETYNSMGEGASKDRIKGLIDSFNSEYKGFEDDLSNLSEEQVVRIKFEYDLAQLQSDIDNLTRKAEDSGSSEDWAEALAARQNYINQSKNRLGLDKEGAKIPVAMEITEQSIQESREKLKNASEEERPQILAEISNKTQLQQDILDSISAAHPEITPDTDLSVINDVIGNYNGEINVTAKVTQEDVAGMLDQMQAGATINYTADVNGVESTVKAVKNEDGSITYTTNINGVDQQITSSGVLNKNGLVTYTINDSNVLSYTPPNKTATVYYNQAEAAKRHAPASQGGNGVNGTAHYRGTAFAHGNWGTKGSGTALGGELGQELVVRGSRWHTIGDNGAEFFKYKRGDIIFNAEQTRQLFEKGKISYGNTRGNALASGTAFRLGGTTSSGSGGSGKTSKGSSKDKKSKKKAKTAMEKFQAWFDKLFDWIEIRLDRQQKRIEKAIHNAERLSKAGLVDKAATQYRSAISAQHTQMANAQQAEFRYDKQAEAVLTKAMSTKNKKGKALLSKSQAATIRARVANGTIDISSYSKNLQEIIKDYQQWYDKAREAGEKAQEMSESIVDSYKTIADSYKEASEARMSLAKTRSGNAATASAKNDYLVSAAEELNKQTQADRDAIAGIQNEMGANGQAAKSVANFGGAAITKAQLKTSGKVNGKKLTKAQIKANKETNKKNAEKTAAAASVAEQAKSYARSGQSIPSGIMDKLASYVNQGFLSTAFYSACLNYNSVRANGPAAIAEMQRQLEEDEANAVAERISIGSEMVENVEDEQQRNINRLELAGANYAAMEDALGKQRDAIRAAIQRNKELGFWAEDTPELLEKENDVLDLENKIAQLAYDKIESDLDLLDSIAAYNKSLADLKEAQSKDLAASDYINQIDDNNKKIAEYQKQASKAYSDYTKAMADPTGGWKGKMADEYLKLYNDALENVNSLRISNEELKDSLRDDVYWRTFERAHDKAQRLLDVVSEIAELISEDMYFRDGNLTSFGAAQIANLTKQYELAREEVQNYSNDIRNLNYLYDQGEYEAEEYKEKLAELQSGLLDSAKNMKGYIDDIISMYKDLDQAELDSLFKLIDKRNDALNAKKEYYDYDKTIRGKTKDIQELTAQIAALEGVNTAEAKAQRAKLQEQLSEAQEDLEDTERDHYFSMMQDALSDMKDTLQEQFDDKWEYLSQDLTNIIKLIAAANDLATTNADRIERTLTDLLSFYGINAGETGVDEAYKRHAAGSRRIRSGHIGLSSERGNEIIVTKNGIISHFNPGDGVVPADLTERLYNLAQSVKPGSSLGRPNIGKISPSSGITINQNYDSMLNIEGSADAATVSDLKRMSKDLLEKSYDYTSKRIQHDYTRTGGLRRA